MPYSSHSQGIIDADTQIIGQSSPLCAALESTRQPPVQPRHLAQRIRLDGHVPALVVAQHVPEQLQEETHGTAVLERDSPAEQQRRKVAVEVRVLDGRQRLFVMKQQR